MGMNTDLQIEDWQKEHGIEPATNEMRQLWCQLQDAAFGAIKIAELEKAGIRDGDGRWHGSDVVVGALEKLELIISRITDDQT